MQSHKKTGSTCHRQMSMYSLLPVFLFLIPDPTAKQYSQHRVMPPLRLTVKFLLTQPSVPL